MEKVLFSGAASAVPSGLITDDEVVTFLQVCKYLECQVIITEDNDDIFFRANIPEDILERGYIEIQRERISLEVKEITNPDKKETAMTEQTTQQQTTSAATEAMADQYASLLAKMNGLEDKLSQAETDFKAYKNETDHAYSQLKNTFQQSIQKETSVVMKAAKVIGAGVFVAGAAAAGVWAYNTYFKVPAASE